MISNLILTDFFVSAMGVATYPKSLYNFSNPLNPVNPAKIYFLLSPLLCKACSIRSLSWFSTSLLVIFPAFWEIHPRQRNPNPTFNVEVQQGMKKQLQVVF
jgi:hypothetical protein